MRRLAYSLLAAIPFAHATIYPEHQNPIRSVVLNFESGDSVSFQLAEERVASIEFRVLGAPYSATMTGCRTLKDIHYESTRFLWDREDRRKVGTFTITFRMGDETARQFGELPLVQINFVNKRFTTSAITRNTAANSSVSSPLCSNDSFPFTRRKANTN